MPDTVFPAEKPFIADTPSGRICLGTPGDDVYTGDYAVLIDPGGNDTYRNCRIGAAYGKATPELGSGQVGYFADLGGDDLYDCADVDITLGAAVLGVAAFYDLGGGNDRYYGGSVSLGAAIGGVATFYDDGGSDAYSGKVYTQGAAGFGIAIMCDDSVQPAPDVPTDEETPDPIDLAAFDNDTYTAWSSAQAFARTRGIAICTNARGNETYHAGGVYLHAPLFSDRYQSFSQGFAIGERDIDYAGGIALLADYAGNDRYLGDVYNQGVGYWYSAGFLYDGGGNDHYEMTQYGQASGIHLAVGGLIDEGGSDCYIIHNGLGQGSSHDYAAAVFMDRGGDDRYLGNTTCNGSAVTNSVGLFFDRGGNDIYAGKRRNGVNYGGAARGFGSIGVLVDVVGEDDYLGQMSEDSLWTHLDYGLGIDVGPGQGAALLEMAAQGATTGLVPGDLPSADAPKPAGFDTPSAQAVMPAVVSYEGPLTQAVFDELWEIAIRWEVGDNRVIVPAARQRLIAFGPEVLPFIEAEMDDPNSLAVRAFDGILGAFFVEVAPGTPTVPSAAEVLATGHVPTAETTASVQALLRRQLASEDDNRKTAALRVIGDLKLAALGDGVAGLLGHADLSMRRRAIGVLGLSGSHLADEQLLTLLRPETEETILKTAIESATALKLDCFEQLIPLLGDPRFAVRDTLLRQLVAQTDTYDAHLRELLVGRLMRSSQPGQGLEPRALRTLIRYFLGRDALPDSSMVDALWTLMSETDRGVLSDAAELVRHWDELTRDDPQLNAAFGGNSGLQRELASYGEQHPADRVVRIIPPPVPEPQP